MIINTEFNTEEDCYDEEYGLTTYPYYADMFDGEEEDNYTIKDFLLKSSKRKSNNINSFKNINQHKVNTKYNKNLKQRFNTNRKIFK